uniref:Uncharacterized protein n=1 Tax=Oryza brachyantha TaxID=4533 RepID=J3MRJ6_ORYBR
MSSLHATSVNLADRLQLKCSHDLLSHRMVLNNFWLCHWICGSNGNHTANITYQANLKQLADELRWASPPPQSVHVQPKFKKVIKHPYCVKNILADAPPRGAYACAATSIRPAVADMWQQRQPTTRPTAPTKANLKQPVDADELDRNVSSNLFAAGAVSTNLDKE